MSRYRTPLIILASLVLLFALGFRIEHPHSGFKTVVGSASSSLVITQKSESYSVGQKVVASSASKDLSPILGQVTAVSGTTYSITNGTFLESVDAEKINGKMIVVLPFLGYFFNIIGL